MGYGVKGLLGLVEDGGGVIAENRVYLRNGGIKKSRPALGGGLCQYWVCRVLTGGLTGAFRGCAMVSPRHAARRGGGMVERDV